jgi:hypothetical protein
MRTVWLRNICAKCRFDSCRPRACAWSCVQPCGLALRAARDAAGNRLNGKETIRLSRAAMAEGCRRRSRLCHNYSLTDQLLWFWSHCDSKRNRRGVKQRLRNFAPRPSRVWRASPFCLSVLSCPSTSTPRHPITSLSTVSALRRPSAVCSRRCTLYTLVPRRPLIA